MSTPKETITMNTTRSPAQMRAIAALEKAQGSQAVQQPQVHATQHSAPVPNPNQVSPEDMGAITHNQVQNDTIVESKSSETAEAIKAVKEEQKIKTDEEPLSSQYAQLAKKERALRAKAHAQEQALKAREAALLEKEKALLAKDAEYNTNYIPKNRLTEDTMSVLLESGITYDQLTQMALNQSQVQQDPQMKLAIQRLEAEIKSAKEMQEKANKSFEEQQKQQYQQAVSQIRAEAKSIINSNPEFETIKETNSIDDVVELIEQTFNSDGILLSVEEAATEVENYLVEEAMKLARLKKIQMKLNPPAKQDSGTQAPQKTQQQSAPQGLKTLTNAVGSSRPLSARERAFLAFKGELKN